MFAGVQGRWRLFLQIVFIILFGIGVILLVVSRGKDGSSTQMRRVEFRVEASGGYAIITLDAGDVSMPKPTTVTVPWNKTTRIASGSEVYLIASNPTQTGKLTCTILLADTVWKTATTAAPKDGVACAGIVP